MSHGENTKLMENFMGNCEIVILCPYCYRPNQLDPPIGCCGEVHADEFLEHPDLDEPFHPDDMGEAFHKWMSKRGEK